MIIIKLKRLLLCLRVFNSVNRFQIIKRLPERRTFTVPVLSSGPLGHGLRCEIDGVLKRRDLPFSVTPILPSHSSDRLGEFLLLF